MNRNPYGKKPNPEHKTYRKPSDPPKGSYTSNYTLFCCAAILLLILANFKIFSGIITGNPDTFTEAPETFEQPLENEPSESEIAIQKELETSFEKIPVSFGDTKRGNLVLINNEFAYDFNASTTIIENEQLVPFVQYMTNNYVVSYPAKETMTLEAITAFNDMANDFAAETGHRDLFVLDSIRSYEDQERVYAEKGGEIATIPGHSEHHTGLAFDLELYIGGQRADYDGTGDYAWIDNNCHKYGYILRYPESKTPLTGITYEPWHYRYVGKEHAYYMKKNNLCLEEYLKLLDTKPVTSERLRFTTDEGETYMVYSQKVTGDSSEIYVPKNYPYTLSGDNRGNIIVSCLTASSTDAR